MRRRTRRERGATLVEFALIVPLLFLILFGIIEFGMALNDFQSIRQGVREGARQAVVREVSSGGTGCLQGGVTFSQSEAENTACLTKDRIGLGDTVLVRLVYAEDSTGEQSVKVCARRNVDPVTGLIPAIDGITLKSSIQMRAEKAIPDELIDGSPFSEDPAGDWSWC